MFSPMLKLQEKIVGGALKLAGGLALGAAEGATLSKIPVKSGGTLAAGRLVGKAATAPVGLAARAAGSALVGVAPNVPGAAVSGVAGVGAGMLNVAAQTGAVLSRVGGAITRKTERNLGNLLLGRELRQGAALGIELGLMGLAISTGMHRGKQAAALGYVDVEKQTAPSLSYDGMTPPPPSRMGNMGGTGDLVMSLHTNRHG
jgi:hypothetical protein